jgi:serine/threonine-protein kinase RsbW
MHWNSVIERSIPSDSAEGKALISELLAELTQLSWGEHELFGVHLAVEEALVNAIKHGNRNDGSKQVHVVLKLAEQDIRIEISDEGKGFDPAAVPDPTDEENLEIPSGRGLMLMRNFMNSVEFSEQGTHVVMEKKRD